IDDAVRKLELFEEPARPARWHRTAIAIPQADPRRLEWHSFLSRRDRRADEACAKLGRDLLEPCLCTGFLGGEVQPRRMDRAFDCECSLQPADFFTRGNQLIHSPKGVIGPHVQEEADSVLRVEDLSRRRLHFNLEFLEGPIEAVEYTIEAHAHL